VPPPPPSPASAAPQFQVVAEDPVKATLLRVLGYDITMDTRENMAAKLEAAARAAVYED